MKARKLQIYCKLHVDRSRSGGGSFEILLKPARGISGPIFDKAVGGKANDSLYECSAQYCTYRYQMGGKRWGIVSAGKISHDFVNAVNSWPEKSIDIVAVAARDMVRAKEFAKVHKIQHAFDSYKALAKSEKIDVAYISVLNPDHYKLAKLFLENGKHVLCEKPLCMNRKQSKSLLDFAKKKKLFLMEAVWVRFLPAYYALEEEIQSGSLGDILYATVNLGLPLHGVDRVAKKELGGSILLDIGVYTLQFAQFVFKEEPINVTTVGTVNEHGVDESVTIVLEYSGGRRAVLNVHSKILMDNSAVIYGTKGSIKLPHNFHTTDRLQTVAGTMREFPLHKSDIPYNFHNSAGLAFQTKEVQQCINSGLLESPRMSHAESLLLAKLEDTIRDQLGVHFDADYYTY